MDAGTRDYLGIGNALSHPLEGFIAHASHIGRHTQRVLCSTYVGGGVFLGVIPGMILDGCNSTDRLQRCDSWFGWSDVVVGGDADMREDWGFGDFVHGANSRNSR